jgi:hypothetical protein
MSIEEVYKNAAKACVEWDQVLTILRSVGLGEVRTRECHLGRSTGAECLLHQIGYLQIQCESSGSRSDAVDELDNHRGGV